MTPGLRIARVEGMMRDPLDFLMDQLEPPPLLSDAELELALSRMPPDQIIIGMDRQPNGEHVATHFIVPVNSRRQRRR
jgi:hypothetical protein